jgi:uncharacterized protein YggL (DUF469 family)
MMNCIQIQGCIQKENNKPFSENDHEKFLDLFIEFVEANGWMFGGGTEIIEEEQLKQDSDEM